MTQNESNYQMDVENKLKHAQNSLFALAILKFGKMMKRKALKEEFNQKGLSSAKSNKFFNSLMSKYPNANECRRLSAPYENAINKLVLNLQRTSDPPQLKG